MTKEKESKSKARNQSKSHGFKSPCCGSGDIAQMIHKFCGSKDGGFDCSAMMEKMCGRDQEKCDQQ